MRAVLTREWILEQLIDNAKEARDAGNTAAANRSYELLGKEIGMFIERKEAGKPGDFASLQAPSEVLDQVRRELGDEAADAIAKVLARSAPRADFERSTETENENPQDLQ